MTVENQFPEETATKNVVIEAVQERLRTNPTETRFLEKGKLRSDNYTEHPYLIFANALTHFLKVVNPKGDVAINLDIIKLFTGIYNESRYGETRF